MPTPRPIATVAKHVLLALLRELEAETALITDISHYTHTDNPDEAHRAMREALEINLLAVRVLNSLICNHILDAETALTEYQQKKGRRT